MLALDGIKVLDLTTFPTASVAVMLLVDMGAEAIKIEQPNRRQGGDLEGASADDEMTRLAKAVYQFDERGKKRICLNLKMNEGREAFHRLARTADVVIDEFRPGVTQRLGADYRTLSAINPRVICCSVTGYGQEGPYSRLPGHDTNYISIAGILGTTGTADGQHAIPGIPIGDFAGGAMQATIGILLALIAREKTGKGQFVDVSMVDALAMFMLIRHGPDFFRTGREPRLGERPALVFETKDGGYVNIAPGEPWFWERLCRTMGLEQFIPYQRAVGTFAPDTEAMQQKRQQILTAFQTTFRTKTRDEWVRILREADTCVSPVYDLREVISDLHLAQRGAIVDVAHPNLGTFKQPGVMIKLSETPGRIKEVPVLPGQNTEEVLRTVGYREDEIADLRKAGAIN